MKSSMLVSFLLSFSGNTIPTDSLLHPENDLVPLWENRLEELAETNPEEYEETMAEIRQYAEQPIDLNTADEKTLLRTGLLDAWQIKALLHYRESYGQIVRWEELTENLEGFDNRIVEALRPFVCLQAGEVHKLPPFKEVAKRGKHRLLARYGRMLKPSKAFTDHKYAGNPDNVYFRYTFDFKNRIRIGFAAKQGAGEAFGRQGFDFYCGYLALDGFGCVKSWVAGTYKLDFGYGLNVHSPSGFYSGLQADLPAGNGQGIRPYASGAEYGYLKGSAIQLSFPKAWSASLFYSTDRHDAILESPDSAPADFWDCVNSFPQTGYHRTANEIKGKEAARLQVFGGMVEKSTACARFGIVASGHVLGGPYSPEHATALSAPRPYSQVKPASGANFSAYYRYLSPHFHFYGEYALAQTLQGAVLQGIQYKGSETVSLAVQYSWHGAGYYAPYAGIGNSRPPRPAFTGTERHVFSWHGKAALPAGFLLEFSGKESIEKKNAGMPSLSDVFSGTLRYQARRFSACLRFKLDRGQTRKGHSLRLNAAYEAANGFFGESRLELRDFSKGILLMQDAGYAGPKGGFRLRLRVALFHTQGYENRIYAYEHDIRQAASAPALYGKGMRFFILMGKSFGKFGAEIKYAHTLMDGVRSIGSGDNLVKGFLKPEIKVQLHLKL